MIEVLVTVVIIGLLATVTVYSYGAALSRSRDQHRITDLNNISNALEQYYLDHKAYPRSAVNSNQILNASYQLDSTLQKQCGPAGDSLTPTYLTDIPEDPQNKMTLLPSNGGALCTKTPPTNAGQYLYTVADNNSSPHSYWLMARMERQSNASNSTPTLSVAPFNTYINSLCDATTFNAVNCSENYYIGPKNGQ